MRSLSLVRLLPNRNIHPARLVRIAPYDLNLHAFGGHIMKVPTSFYPNGGVTDGFFMSREAYERMLRGLVRNFSNRIQWVTGTVTGLKAAKDARQNGELRVESALVRLPNGEEQTISGSLVIGEFSFIPSSERASESLSTSFAYLSFRRLLW